MELVTIPDDDSGLTSPAFYQKSWAGTRPNRNRHVPDLSDFTAEDLADSAGPAAPSAFFALRYHAVPETRSGRFDNAGTPARALNHQPRFSACGGGWSWKSLSRTSRDHAIARCQAPRHPRGAWAPLDAFGLGWPARSSFVGGDLGLERDGTDQRMGREADQEYGLSATSEVMRPHVTTKTTTRPFAKGGRPEIPKTQRDRWGITPSRPVQETPVPRASIDGQRFALAAAKLMTNVQRATDRSAAAASLSLAKEKTCGDGQIG
ncbi:hypothetical protein NL676_031395 [Syzygium grande]|nr:hypothetical protein NL676_031395 [Syzygium grande]